MGGDTDRPSSSKHKRHHDKDRDGEHKSTKRQKHGDHGKESDRRSKKRSSKGKEKDKLNIIDDDPDEDMWVEKNIDMDGENVRIVELNSSLCWTSMFAFQPLTTDIPTAESLKLTSHATNMENDPALPPSRATETKIKRDEWMLMPPSAVTVPIPESRAPTSGVTSRLQDSMEQESLTESYGDPAASSRAMGGRCRLLRKSGH